MKKIINWFKAAKPNPTLEDACVQIGCHYEEVAEMMTSLDDSSAYSVNGIADTYKEKTHFAKYTISTLNDEGKLELLDALCDQVVTAVGSGYMMGFDIEGALNEVIRSNNSKMVDGKFIFDKNGKIMKPETYSKPDLEAFINVGILQEKS